MTHKVEYVVIKSIHFVYRILSKNSSHLVQQKDLLELFTLTKILNFQAKLEYDETLESTLDS